MFIVSLRLGHFFPLCISKNHRDLHLSKSQSLILDRQHQPFYNTIKSAAACGNASVIMHGQPSVHRQDHHLIMFYEGCAGDAVIGQPAAFHSRDNVSATSSVFEGWGDQSTDPCLAEHVTDDVDCRL